MYNDEKNINYTDVLSLSRLHHNVFDIVEPMKNILTK